MIDIKTMYQDLWNAVNGICDKTILRSRPKSVDERIANYIVVKLPYRIDNNEIDESGSYNDYSTTAQIEVYVRDQVSASNLNGFNINVMDEKVKKVLSKFPISTKNIVVNNPRVAIQADDGDGFAIVVIQCNLRTK